MKLLLDTHILLWWLAGDKRLTKAACQLISNPEYNILISIASLWEIAIKSRKGKLNVDLEELIQELQNENMQLLTINTNHLSALAKLQKHHEDPFDHILIAQTITETVRLITHDQKISLYSELVILV